MVRFESVVTDPLGLHARPAGMLVKLAAGFSCRITLEYGEKSADAKRIFAVMSLGIRQGGIVAVRAEGEDENEAAGALSDFFAENL